MSRPVPENLAPDRPTLTHPAAAVARQIVQALAGQGQEAGVPLELALDPPELGRVRLSFAEVNGTLTLAIAVERPETADLMRRHLALLSEEFARAGLEAPSVSISQHGADGRQAPRGPAVDQRSTPPDPAMEAAVARADRAPLAAAGGLDLRL